MLFAPANHPRRAERIADFGADAVTLDLEDAVADSEKAAARSGVTASLATYRDALRCVRINGLATGLATDDLAAVVCDALDLVVVPKVESATELRIVDEHLGRLERARGLAEGAVRLLPTIETARGILAVESIAAGAPARLLTLLFGIGDYTADLGIAPTPDAAELIYPRSRLVVVCRAFGLAPPIDGPFLGIEDEQGYREDSWRSRDLGFQGRLAIHPNQVQWANDVYGGLRPGELQRLERIVEAFEAAEADGAAAIRVDGMFVDYPIYRQAKRRLDDQQVMDA